MLFNFRKKRSCMEREILEQSEISQRIIDAYVSSDGNISIDLPQNINRIILVASGSSYHCARYAAELFGTISKIEASAVYSSEFLLENTIAHDENILYIFITQSGETTDTNSALEKAKEHGVKLFVSPTRKIQLSGTHLITKLLALREKKKALPQQNLSHRNCYAQHF